MQLREYVGFKNTAGIRAVIENIREHPYHMHENILEMICVLKGTYEVSNDASDHMLSEGDVFFFNHSNIHRIKAMSDDTALLIIQIELTRYAGKFRQFHEEENYSILDAFFICGSFYSEGKQSADIRYLRFLMAHLYMMYRENASEIALEQETEILLEYILSNFQNYYYTKLGASNYVLIQKEPLIGGERIYRIIDYISDHYMEKLTLAEIAEREHMNVSYLSAYISKASGLTFSSLVSITRCEQAEQLLIGTDANLDTIAVKVGFANRALLIRQFRKWFGKTPDCFRKEVRKTCEKGNGAQYIPLDEKRLKERIEEMLDGK